MMTEGRRFVEERSAKGKAARTTSPRINGRADIRPGRVMGSALRRCHHTAPAHRPANQMSRRTSPESLTPSKSPHRSGKPTSPQAVDLETERPPARYALPKQAPADGRRLLPGSLGE